MSNGNGNGYRFFTRSGRPLDKATYLAQLEGRNLSIGNLIRRARVSAANVKVLPPEPSNRYTAIMSQIPATPFVRYANYLVFYLYEDVWLFVPPARAGIVQHEYLGIQYAYDKAARAWNPTNLPGAILESSSGGGAPDKLGISVSGPFASGNYISLRSRSGIFPISGTALHDIRVGTPVFIGFPGGVARGIVGFTTDLSKISANMPEDTSAVDPRFSTGLMGQVMPRDVPISLLGVVIESRDRTVITTSEQILYTTEGYFREDLLPQAVSAPINFDNVYFHFLRRENTTDWFAYGYSSLDSSSDVTILGVTYNRRSLIIDSGAGLRNESYIRIASGSRQIILP